MDVNGDAPAQSLRFKGCDVACKHMCVLSALLSLESGFCAFVPDPVNLNRARVKVGQKIITASKLHGYSSMGVYDFIDSTDAIYCIKYCGPGWIRTSNVSHVPDLQSGAFNQFGALTLVLTDESSERRDSNSRPPDPKSGALPPALRSVVGDAV